MLFNIAGCYVNKSSNCTYSVAEQNKSLIPLKFKNIWNLCPIFDLNNALERAENENKDVLIIFYATIFSGNDYKIWEALDLKKNSNIINKKFILCPLNVEELENKKKQILFTNSIELASIVVISIKEEVLSNVLFYQGESIQDEKLNTFLETY